MKDSVCELLLFGEKSLKLAEVFSPRKTAEFLLGFIIGASRSDLYLLSDFVPREEDRNQFISYVERAGKGEPPEYIVGKISFYGCEFEVGPDVLIPRPETEVWLDAAAKEIVPGKPAIVWDLCTGSGCIGISLKKKFPFLSVSLSDIEEKALAVAGRNAFRNGVSVELLSGDLFSPFLGKKAHYIFCNPPYITKEEYEFLDPSVKNYEPCSALIGGETGLEYYRRLSEGFSDFVYPGVKLFFEIGAGQGDSVKKLFSGHPHKKMEVFSDYAGHDRFFFLEIE